MNVWRETVIKNQILPCIIWRCPLYCYSIEHFPLCVCLYYLYVTSICSLQVSLCSIVNIWLCLISARAGTVVVAVSNLYWASTSIQSVLLYNVTCVTLNIYLCSPICLKNDSSYKPFVWGINLLKPSFHCKLLVIIMCVYCTLDLI